MAKGFINEDTLQDIADAIREKTGDTDTMLPSEMAGKIMEIPEGEDLMFKQITNATDFTYIIPIEAEEHMTSNGLYYSNVKKLICSKGVKTFPIYFCTNSAVIEIYILEEQGTGYGDGNFHNNSSLKTLYCLHNVLSPDMFGGNSSLKNVHFPNLVTLRYRLPNMSGLTYSVFNNVNTTFYFPSLTSIYFENMFGSNARVILKQHNVSLYSISRAEVGKIYVPLSDIEYYRTDEVWSTLNKPIIPYGQEENKEIGETFIPTNVPSEVTNWVLVSCNTDNNDIGTFNTQTGQLLITRRGVFEDEYSSHALIIGRNSSNEEVYACLVHVK